MKKRSPHRRWTCLLLTLTAGAAGANDSLEHASETAPRQVLTHAPMMVGVVSASRALDLAPPVEGRLEQLQVHLGERIQAGQVLAKLDTRTRQLELATRQAQLKAAESEHSRYAVLLEQAQQQLERAERIRDYTSAEELEKASHLVALSAADVELSKARRSEAQTAVALARENLDQASIRAPFDGTVSEEYLQPGMLANRATPIVRLVGEERVLRLAIPESLAGSVRPGHAVRVRIDETTELQGVIERISPELDTSSRQLKAEARLNVPPAARERLPIGTVVQVQWLSPGSP